MIVVMVKARRNKVCSLIADKTLNSLKLLMMQ